MPQVNYVQVLTCIPGSQINCDAAVFFSMVRWLGAATLALACSEENSNI